LVIEKANVTAITEAVGVVTAITKGASKKFFSYDLPAETSGLTENINASVQNGTVFYENNGFLIETDTAQGGAASSITLAVGASGTTDFYKNY
jgi:hypothetical protein